MFFELVSKVAAAAAALPTDTGEKNYRHRREELQHTTVTTYSNLTYVWQNELYSSNTQANASYLSVTICM